MRLYSTRLMRRLTLAFSFLFSKYLINPVDPNGAVLITGCSSGFGFTTAQHLADLGMTVFAGVRKLEDAAELSKGSPERAKRIIPVIIDVTKQDEVAACFETVRTTLEKSGKKLEAVINNAGLGFNLPTEILPEDRMRYLWEVNYFGALRVTRTFLPLLREAPQDRRRIVFVGSVSSGGMTKFFATYSASKAAVEVSADELRRELLQWGVKVSVIEPGVFHTKFTKNTGIAKTEFESMVAGGSELAKSYEAKYLKFWKTAMYPPHIPGNGLNRVAEAIDYCIRARFPPAKRGVGTESHLLQGLAMVVPDSVQDFLVGMVL